MADDEKHGEPAPDQDESQVEDTREGIEDLDPSEADSKDVTGGLKTRHFQEP